MLESMLSRIQNQSKAKLVEHKKENRKKNKLVELLRNVNKITCYKNLAK